MAVSDFSTTYSAPWAPAQSYLENALGGANDLWHQGQGWTPYRGNANAPLNRDTRLGLARARKLAGQRVPGLLDAQNYATDMIKNRGMSAELNGVADRYKAFADSENGLTSGQEEAVGFLNPFARGDYTEDPRLTERLNQDRQDAMNSSATAFGGGRYGSAAIGAGMGKALSRATNDTLLQSNENARNPQLQASGMVGNMYTTGANQKLGATGALGDLYEGGLARSQGAAGLLPMLNELRYDGAARQAGVGDFYQNRAQAEQDKRISDWNMRQEAPWQRLNSASRIIQGTAGQGSQSVGYKPKAKTPWWQTALGAVGMGSKLASGLPSWGSSPAYGSTPGAGGLY